MLNIWGNVYDFINFYLLMNMGQGTFLPLVVPPTKYHAALWSIWLAVLCSLKVKYCYFYSGF